MSIKTILVPFDSGPSSRLALEKACQLGQQLKAELHVVHVLGGTPDKMQQQLALDNLQTIVQPSYEIRNKVHREVLVGNVHEEVIKYAKKIAADLIVMGKRNQAISILSMVIGSVSQHIIKTAFCPVVLTPVKNQQVENGVQDESDHKYESLKSSDSPALDLLARAISLRSTDIHVDPIDNSRYSVRFRVDGDLITYCDIDHKVAEHLIHQCMALAQLDHAEPFQPHEGRLILPASLREIETRITVAPVAGGVAMALRLFVKENATFSIEGLGFIDSAVGAVYRMVHGNEGLILVTGPTGSGKTTTVYSLLKTFGDRKRNIVAIEDPVEFNVPFVRQMSVDERHGVTMTSGLKTLLRMDPNIVFVGEIRDAETAGIAMRAAGSGRFVFSSLHTRDVASAVTGLRDLQVTNHSISGNLVGVINQRLIRRLCAHCRKTVEPSNDCKATFAEYGLELPSEVYEANGCDDCRGTGYKGRCGVFECVAVDHDLAKAISENTPESELRRLIRSQGTTCLLVDSLAKCKDGTTSFEEARSARWI